MGTDKQLPHLRISTEGLRDTASRGARSASALIEWLQGTVLLAAARNFSRDKAIDMAAALAFYAILSAGPLLVVILAVADSLWGREAAMHQLLSQLQGQVGPDTARTLETAVANSRIPGEIGIAATVSLSLLLFSSTLLFAQLRESLMTIWHLPEPEGAIRSFLKQRLLALITILVVGVLLLVSTLMSSVVSILRDWIAAPLPPSARVGIDWLASWLWFAILVGVLFRALSARAYAWTNVLIGAAVTSSLFLVGKELLALYLSKATVASAYGTAGALASMALWVYYSSMALFFGAEYAHAWQEAHPPAASQLHLSG